MTDSELKPMNVPLPKAMDEEGFELSDEQLESVAGGKLSDQDIGEYRTIMAHYKKAGWTKEKFVAGYDFLESQQQQEIA
ncbi:MAG: hypothetical protein ACOYIP_06200 [Coriobacteriales bacterium]|jgi:hypothetical protein